MPKTIILLLILISVLSINSLYAKKNCPKTETPDWWQQQVTQDADYYYGYGEHKKSNKANKLALTNLSENIAVTIEKSVTQETVDKNGRVKKALAVTSKLESGYKFKGHENFGSYKTSNCIWRKAVKISKKQIAADRDWQLYQTDYKIVSNTSNDLNTRYSALQRIEKLFNNINFALLTGENKDHHQKLLNELKAEITAKVSAAEKLIILKLPKDFNDAYFTEYYQLKLLNAAAKKLNYSIFNSFCYDLQQCYDLVENLPYANLVILDLDRIEYDTTHSSINLAKINITLTHTNKLTNSNNKLKLHAQIKYRLKRKILWDELITWLLDDKEIETIALNSNSQQPTKTSVPEQTTQQQ